MVHIILSDIHGNVPAFKAVIGDVESRSYQEIICAGDIVGYGADPGKCMEMVRNFSAESVLGNHDAAVIGKTGITYFNEYAKEAVLWTEEQMTPAEKEYLADLPYIIERMISLWSTERCIIRKNLCI